MILGVLDLLHFLLVVYAYSSHVPHVVSYLHLFLNQVLSPCKGTNKLISLLLLKSPDLSLINDIVLPQLPLLGLQLNLFINKLLSQYSLLIVQIEED